jgi:hypothetical protein
MTVGVFRISFSSKVPLDEAEMTLHLATFAVEGLFGAAQVRIDFSYHIDADRRAMYIDGSNDVGATVVQVYVGLLLREFGEDSFQVERVSEPAPQHEEVAA